MKLINPNIEMITDINGKMILKHLEIAIRNAYKSEDKITDTSHLNLIKLIMTNKHLSTLEHSSVTFRVTCSRACMAQWTRHRVGWSYTIESQRFVNYSKEKFNKQIAYIKPINYTDWTTEQMFIFSEHLKISEQAYFKLLKSGLKPEDARNVLNNAVKTEMVVTTNLRSLLDFLKTRTDKHAQSEIRYLAKQLLSELRKEIPIIFDEIVV
jgi:thymidylate synthase (FAD)